MDGQVTTWVQRHRPVTWAHLVASFEDGIVRTKCGVRMAQQVASGTLIVVKGDTQPCPRCKAEN